MKTSELTRLQLNWAVATCEGYSNLRRNPHKFNTALIMTPPRENYGPVLLADIDFTFDWAQGGPIIEREGISIRNEGLNSWYAVTLKGEKAFRSCEGFDGGGDTPLVAAMRCYVALKMGDEVEIPEELL